MGEGQRKNSDRETEQIETASLACSFPSWVLFVFWGCGFFFFGSFLFHLCSYFPLLWLIRKLQVLLAFQWVSKLEHSSLAVLAKAAGPNLGRGGQAVQ